MPPQFDGCDARQVPEVGKPGTPAYIQYHAACGDSGHDIDLYPFGRDAAPLVAEVKARKNGSGFTQLEKWLGDYQVLFLRRDRADPLVVLPWSTWEALLEKARR